MPTANRRRQFGFVSLYVLEGGHNRKGKENRAASPVDLFVFAIGIFYYPIGRGRPGADFGRQFPG